MKYAKNYLQSTPNYTNKHNFISELGANFDVY